MTDTWVQPKSITVEVIQSICAAGKRYSDRKGGGLPEVQVGFDCLAERRHWIARVRLDARGEPFIHSWERAISPGANEKLRTLEELKSVKMFDDEKKK